MVTEKQFTALKYLICVSEDGNDLMKRILVFLIDQSEGLTKEVCLTLQDGREGYSGEEIHKAAINGMFSSNGNTHLNELMILMGSELDFSLHFGDFDPTREGDPFNTDGQFPGFPKESVAGGDEGLVRKDMPTRYTFWLSRGSYSRDASPVVATRKKLEKIKLENSSRRLYE